MAEKTLKEIQAAVAARFPGVPTFVSSDKASPHLHLYHAASSICAQKVRATFAAIEQPHISHALDLIRGDSYDPDYVRVRLAGCRAAGLPLVKDHIGTTSVTTSGCDTCVVPTVVDETTGEVIVDSRNICIELDRRNPQAPGALMPEELRLEIEAELSLVDDMPNFQLLASTFGRPSADSPMNAFAAAKIVRLDKLLEEYGEDAELRTAYTSKRDKEKHGMDTLFEIDALEDAKTRTVELYAALDKRLEKYPGPYLFGDRFTLADLFWGVEMVRAEDLGHADLWAEARRPRLFAYYQTLCEHPAIRRAVLDCPGARFQH